MKLEQALSKARNICSKQEKCISEIRLKLAEWEVAEDDQGKIINALVKEKYINETRYSVSFVNDKLKFNKWGAIKIRFYLSQKGIKEEVINESIAQLEKTEYLNILESLLKGKLKTLVKFENSVKYQKLISFAYGKGFSFEDSNMIVRKLLDNSLG